MSPGLPGLGLGGLFFIFTALLAPAIELVRTARGQSSVEAWRGVGRQFAIAVMMIIGVDLTIRGALLAASLVGGSDGASDPGMTALPVVPLGITVALLATLLGGVKALELCLRVRHRGLPGTSFQARALAFRAMPGAGILTAVWLAMLVFGAAELSSVSGGGGPAAPDSAIAAKPEETDGPGIGADAERDSGGGPRASASDDRTRSDAPARAARTRTGAVAGAASRPRGERRRHPPPPSEHPSPEPAEIPEADAVAGGPPPDASPPPDQGAPSSNGASAGEGTPGERPSAPPVSPPGRDGSGPIPPAHASAPAHAGPATGPGSPVTVTP
jgi:hypothetical protein